MSITPVSGVTSPGAMPYGPSPVGRRTGAAQAEGDAATLDPAEIGRQLRNGATVAEVAAAKGVSAAKL